MNHQWMLDLCRRVKQTNALQHFLVLQRAHQGWPEPTQDTEQLIIEMILLRYKARVEKQFERADSYRYVLLRLGLAVDELDKELKGGVK